MSQVTDNGTTNSKDNKGSSEQVEASEALIFVNGKEFEGKLSDIKSDDIKYINVFKPGTDVEHTGRKEARAY